ncbi:MAG: HAD hydrolase-like protein [Lachnospiraceae bacterium]|nr:HAD hydrolase-like protein [Lachnospiraceae bacterium]
MADIKDILNDNKGNSVAIYGLSTETERFLNEHGESVKVIGLLDGFRTDGEMYGYPIIPLETIVSKDVKLIIVVARPGSCKAISKRIGDFCRLNDIAVFDVRGRDLLAETAVNYDFKGLKPYTRDELLEKCEKADLISFDLFDTLITRKVPSYTDGFDLLAIRLSDRNIDIPDFASLRLSAEKECSKDHSPVLTEIYADLLKRAGCSTVTAHELYEMEWDLDITFMVPRKAVCDIFRELVKQGKRVVITTDNYYRRDKLEKLLEIFELDGYEDILDSCEYDTTKTQRLYEKLCEANNGNAAGILHIGDDEYADIESAHKFGIETFRIYSGIDLFDSLGGLNLEKNVSGISDTVKKGLFISRQFNDPFVFENADLKLSVPDASDIGYLFCAPMITDFALWMLDRVKKDGIPQLLLCARDGYLFDRIYNRSYLNTLKDNREVNSLYFYTSRTAAIRAGVRDLDDLKYVDSMKYFGTEEESLKVRFGIDAGDISDKDGRDKAILNRSEKLRENYHKYMDKIGVKDIPTAMFDFVAKGTSQLYLSRLFSHHLKGYYFLQLEPEFMADKGLDIEPFYTEEEKNSSAIFENYYILETILTAPHPQTAEFDDDGEPVFCEETRSKQDIGCFMRAQEGIVQYFRDYLSIVPQNLRKQNKRLDEQILSLINHVKILDEEFMSLTVEDPFFGRMTEIKNVIG